MAASCSLWFGPSVHGVAQSNCSMLKGQAEKGKKLR